MAAKYKKRADGRYLIQVLIGYKVDGKPKYKNVYAKTIRELEEKAAKVREEVEKGIVVDDGRLTVQKWAERWMELYKANVEHNTKEMYKAALNCHVYPTLGNYRLRELKPHHVQELINNLLSEGKVRTAEIIHLTLNQLLKQAVKNEYIYKNVMESIELPKKTKSEKRALSEKEIEYVRSADLPIKEKTFVILLLTTGLRRGEALALSHNDVDMKNRTILVNKTVIVKSNKMEVKDSPKSSAGNRVVPIIDELYQCLIAYLPNLTNLNLFPTAKNELMTNTAYRRMWEKIINAINVAAGGVIGKLRVDKIANDITPHMFRHTYATLLYNAGVDVKTAQYLLGHNSLQMTLDIYTHLEDKKKEDEIGKFNMFMNNSIQSKFSQEDMAQYTNTVKRDN